MKTPIHSIRAGKIYQLSDQYCMGASYCLVLQIEDNFSATVMWLDTYEIMLEYCGSLKDL